MHTNHITAPPRPDQNAGWATGAHLIALFFALFGAVIVNLCVSRQSVFVRQHSRQSVNFQLNLSTAVIVTLMLGVVLPPAALLWIPISVAGLVMPIVAAVRASRGEWHPYPPMIRFLRDLP